MVNGNNHGNSSSEMLNYKGAFCWEWSDHEELRVPFGTSRLDVSKSWCILLWVKLKSTSYVTLFRKKSRVARGMILFEIVILSTRSYRRLHVNCRNEMDKE